MARKKTVKRSRKLARRSAGKKLIGRRQHSVADVFYKAFFEPDFFQAILANPQAAIKQAGFALPPKHLKQLTEELGNPAAVEGLNKILEAVRMSALKPWVFMTSKSSKLTQ